MGLQEILEKVESFYVVPHTPLQTTAGNYFYPWVSLKIVKYDPYVSSLCGIINCSQWSLEFYIYKENPSTVQAVSIALGVEEVGLGENRYFHEVRTSQNDTNSENLQETENSHSNTSFSNVKEHRFRERSIYFWKNGGD